MAINTKNDTTLTIKYAPARRNNLSLNLLNSSKVTAISVKIAVTISNIVMTVDPVVTIGLEKAGEAQTKRRIIAKRNVACLSILQIFNYSSNGSENDPPAQVFRAVGVHFSG